MKCPNVSEDVRQRTIRAVKAEHFAKKQDDDSTVISTKATASTSKNDAPNMGAAFAKVPMSRKRTTTNKGRRASLSLLTRNIFVRME